MHLKINAQEFETAAKAGSREIAQYFVHAITKLAVIHKSGTALGEIVPKVIIPAAIVGKTRLVLPLPIDLLVWTKDIATLFSYFRKSVLQQYQLKSAEILIAGTGTSRSVKELKALGAHEIKQRVFFNDSLVASRD